MSWDNPCKDTVALHFGHLGGTSQNGDPNSWFPELWSWLIQTFALKSVFDVGCGVGYCQKFFADSGLMTYGLDCEQMKGYHLLPDYFVAHDLTTGAYKHSGEPFDLVWSSECAEHVEQKHVQNVIDTVVHNCGKVVAFCAAPIGAGGYHHVNCQNPPYWIDKFERDGLVYNQNLTDKARSLCPAAYGRGANNYFKRSGLIFIK